MKNIINKNMILNSEYNFLIPYKVKKLIRFGRKFDGGYLVCSDAIKEIENLITLGVGDDISFEIDLEKSNSLRMVHMYDYTVNHFLFIKIIFKYFRRLITFRTKIDNFTYSIRNYINFIKFNNKKNVFLYKQKVVDRVHLPRGAPLTIGERPVLRPFSVLCGELLPFLRAKDKAPVCRVTRRILAIRMGKPQVWNLPLHCSEAFIGSSSACTMT